MTDQQLLVIGASARAACFSARRSSFSPIWIDQFGDQDLVNNFPGSCVPVENYPGGILDVLDDLPLLPFLYTGALENHLQVLEKLEDARELLGNSASVCRAVRDPQLVTACFEAAGIRHPRIYSFSAAEEDNIKDCLIKPRRSAGGLGISFYRSRSDKPSAQFYLQEFIEGESRAGIFIADGKSACLLGVTRQLVGEEFLHAGKFSYCGSIGPLALDKADFEQWSQIGHALAGKFELQGLFGVDVMCRGDDIYPVEINPRYTASMEVLELALQLPLISLHCEACRGLLPTPLSPVNNSMMAKAYLFAGQDLRSPADTGDIYNKTATIPQTADIPRPGTVISRGHPLMTILASVTDQRAAMQTLMERAKLLYSLFEVV